MAKHPIDTKTLTLPAKGFKARFIPPTRKPVDPGQWEKTPLFQWSINAEQHKLQPDLFEEKIGIKKGQT